MRRRLCAWTISGLLAALVLAACSGSGGGGSSDGASNGKLAVTAAESFWASIVAQVGGDRVQLTTIIANPATDPHDYEPSAKDGRAFALAKYVVVNGAGYDGWADKLIAANPSSGRRLLDVGDLAGRKDGDNPHMWYDPAIVDRVVDQVVTDLSALDPADATTFAAHAQALKATGMAPYTDLIAQIKASYAGTPIGVTESVFDDLAGALGLKDATPSGFEQAVAEGTDIAPADRAAFQQLIATKQIKVLVFNSQNTTPDVDTLVTAAKAQSIPVVSVTETLEPATASFQDWQVDQLRRLEQALQQAGR